MTAALRGGRPTATRYRGRRFPRRIRSPSIKFRAGAARLAGRGPAGWKVDGHDRGDELSPQADQFEPWVRYEGRSERYAPKRERHSQSHRLPMADPPRRNAKSCGAGLGLVGMSTVIPIRNSSMLTARAITPTVASMRNCRVSASPRLASNRADWSWRYCSTQAARLIFPLVVVGIDPGWHRDEVPDLRHAH